MNNVLSKVQSVAGLFPGAVAAPTKQAQGYLKLETLMLTKQIFSVQTPYMLSQSMAIESLSITQDETTKYISDVTVTLKQMRSADVLLTTSSAGAFCRADPFSARGPGRPGLTKGKPALYQHPQVRFGGAVMQQIDNLLRQRHAATKVDLGDGTILEIALRHAGATQRRVMDVTRGDFSRRA